MVTKEGLEERKANLETGLANLENEYKQIQANIVATRGAIVEVNHWLGELSEEQDKDE